jgi:hypothetical protein
MTIMYDIIYSSKYIITVICIEVNFTVRQYIKFT